MSTHNNKNLINHRLAHYIATRFCRNIVRFAHDIATVLYSEKRLDPNLNKYSSNFYPLTPEFLSPYPNPCITHALNHTLNHA